MTMTMWQPCSEELPPPKDKGRILVRNDRGVFAVNWFTSEDHEDATFDFWYIDDGKMNIRPLRGAAPHAWMEIPE
jgi:hypothetical protein